MANYCNPSTGKRCRWRRCNLRGHLTILSHNACSLSAPKLQHSCDLIYQYNRVVKPILCFQETWLQSFTPQQNAAAIHIGQTHKWGGGILTLLPTSIPLQHQATGDYFVHVQLLVRTYSILHVLNIYLPPNLPHVANAWQSILDAVDLLLHTNSLVLVT